MIKIGICDNEKEILVEVNYLLSKVAISANLDFKTISFQNGQDLLKYYTKDYLDILFLDIELDDSDGLKIANEIRHKHKDLDINIIFISSHSNYVFQSFDVQPYNFLVKPIASEKFEHIVVDLYQKLTDVGKHNTISFKLKNQINETLVLKKDKIVAIELISSPQRLLRVSTISGEYEVTGRLNTYSELLNSYGFSKIYRSIIINLKFLKRIGLMSVVMDNDVEYPLSRRTRSLLREQYSNYSINN